MTLFDNEVNGKYETDHIHMIVNEEFQFSEQGLADDRIYSVVVHEYIHYYQHFATIYGIQYCRNANILLNETRNFIAKEQEISLPFGIWEHNDEIARYRKYCKDTAGSRFCSFAIGDIEICKDEILKAEKECRAVKIGIYDYSENEVYEEGFYFGYYCVIESMAHLIQKMIYPEAFHNQIPYEAVELVCSSYYPEVIKDPRQMITLCLCALMYDNPGLGFFQVMDIAKQHPEITGIEFYRYFLSNSRIKLERLNKTISSMGSFLLNNYQQSLEKICGCPLSYYKKVIDSFKQDFINSESGLLYWLYCGNPSDRKDFLALVDAYGLPFVESKGWTYIPKNPENGKGYTETAALIGFELVFRRLQKKDGDSCPWFRICSSTMYNEDSTVDENCIYQQWKRKDNCFMVESFRYFGLEDKRFLV